MDPAELDAATEREGRALLAAAKSGLDAPVPACPGWVVADVLGHMGRVHRSVAGILERGTRDLPQEEIPAPPPGDAVVAFYEEGFAELADQVARARHPGEPEPAEADWDTEYLDLVLSVAVVPSLDAALAFIARHGTGLAESIVTRDAGAAERFLGEVDAACVFVNASTRFTDGFEFGFGAEVGISTNRLHARGPMGLRELTTYKYRVRGVMKNGRPSGWSEVAQFQVALEGALPARPGKPILAKKLFKFNPAEEKARKPASVPRPEVRWKPVANAV